MNSLNLDHTKTTRLLASNASDLELAADLLRNDKIVAMPTETVYGLAGHGFSNDAILRVFAAKNRPHNNPLILHVPTKKRALDLFDLSNAPLALARFHKLADSFWPGPLTVIAKKASHVPARATGNLPRVAVRVPRNDATRSIMNLIDFPLVMPSANLSTRPSPTNAEHVLRTLEGRIDAVVDDGTCPVGIESTVVLIDAHAVTILRPGVITAHDIALCLSEPVSYHQPPTLHAPQSPGTAYLHYSPKVASVTCVDANSDVPWDDSITILARAADYAHVCGRQGARSKAAFNVLLGDDPQNYAHELYDALYRCEQVPNNPLVVIMPAQTNELWHAIIDRIGRSQT